MVSSELVSANSKLKVIISYLVEDSLCGNQTAYPEGPLNCCQSRQLVIFIYIPQQQLLIGFDGGNYKPLLIQHPEIADESVIGNHPHPACDLKRGGLVQDAERKGRLFGFG